MEYETYFKMILGSGGIRGAGSQPLYIVLRLRPAYPRRKHKKHTDFSTAWITPERLQPRAALPDNGVATFVLPVKVSA
jgi:hypothetical protein